MAFVIGLIAMSNPFVACEPSHYPQAATDNNPGDATGRRAQAWDEPERRHVAGFRSPNGLSRQHAGAQDGRRGEMA